jgi:hypothetical protein
MASQLQRVAAPDAMAGTCDQGDLSFKQTCHVERSFDVVVPFRVIWITLAGTPAR